MSDTAHRTTAPEDRISLPQRLAYGLGAFVNNLLAASIGGMMIVLNIGLGMNPALVGLLGAIPRLTDAMTDPLMGYISDHTRSRWGRRRPYIFAGALLSGLVYALLWQLPRGQSEGFLFTWFLVGSLLFYVAYTIYATPWVALGYELTPDYHERTRLMGTQNFIGQLAYVASPWFLWIMANPAFFPDQVSGAAGLAVIIAVVVAVVGVLPAILLRERLQQVAESAGSTRLSDGMLSIVKDFTQGFATTLRSDPFRRICVAAFLVFNGFILISAFSSYVVIYYVLGGDTEAGARYLGWAGSLGAVSTFVVIALVTWLATRIGKRRAFLVSTGISMLGYALKWPCYNPEMPWLTLVPAPLLAFGLGGLFTLVPSMIPDVVDLDELDTGERREGMYGAIFWWVIKLGMAAALAGGGILLNLTGFDVALGGAQSAQTIFWLRVCDAGVPFLSSAIAIWLMAGYPLTEARANEVRRQVEERRQARTEPAAG